MTAPRTVTDLLDLAERVLSDSTHIFEDHDNRMEAEELLAHVLGVERDELDGVPEPSRPARDRFLSLVARRAGGEPMPFLTGHIEFWGLDLRVRPGAFVPRPSSELTVDRALRRLRRVKAPAVVDVCTGAGPIALAIASELPNAEVWGTDVLDAGLHQARRNARALGIDNVRFRRGDMYSGLPSRLEGRAALITGHVPYVPQGEVEELPLEVRGFEPEVTLTGQSHDGLTLVRRAVEGAPRWLAPGGWILLEVSDDVGEDVARIAEAVGFEHHGIARDEDELSVVVEGRWRR